MKSFVVTVGLPNLTILTRIGHQSACAYDHVLKRRHAAPSGVWRSIPIIRSFPSQRSTRPNSVPSAPRQTRPPFPLRSFVYSVPYPISNSQYGSLRLLRLLLVGLCVPRRCNRYVDLPKIPSPRLSTSAGLAGNSYRQLVDTATCEKQAFTYTANTGSPSSPMSSLLTLTSV